MIIIHNNLRSLLVATLLVAGTVSPSAAASALEAGDWLVRLRGIAVVPTADGNAILPAFPTASLEAQSSVMPEIDVTYMVTRHFGIELIAATTPHDFEGQGALAGLGDAAHAWLLPPTLLAQYHFDTGTRFRPYVGAGVNVTFTYGENASASLDAALGPTTVKANNSIGYALQAGIDIDFADNWFLNFDLKYIDIDIDIKLKAGGATQTTTVDIDPLIFGVGFGYRF